LVPTILELLLFIYQTVHGRELFMSFSEHYDLSFTLPQHKPDSECGYQLIVTA